MKYIELAEKLNAKKRGTYFVIVYSKLINGYKKTTRTVVRLCNYASVVKKEVTTGTKSNSNDVYLGNNIIFNKNTNKTRLQVFLTKHHKPHVSYEYNGADIDSDTYYENSGDKKSTPTVMFSINIENIVAVYQR